MRASRLSGLRKAGSEEHKDPSGREPYFPQSSGLILPDCRMHFGWTSGMPPSPAGLAPTPVAGPVAGPVARVSAAHPGPAFRGHHSPDARVALIRATKGWKRRAQGPEWPETVFSPVVRLDPVRPSDALRLDIRDAAIASRAGSHTRSRTRSPGKRSAPGASLPWPPFPGCALRAYPGYERQAWFS